LALNVSHVIVCACCWEHFLNIVTVRL